MRRSLIATTVAALFARRNRGGRPAESRRARARPIARRDQARGVSAGCPRRARHVLRDLPRLSAPDVVLHVPAVRQARSRGRVHGRAGLRRLHALAARGLARAAQARVRVLGRSPCTGAPAHRARSPATTTRRSCRTPHTRAPRTTCSTAGSGASASSGAAPLPADEPRARGRRASRAGDSPASPIARPSSPRARSMSAPAHTSM